jgi:hypothetical protein
MSELEKFNSVWKFEGQRAKTTQEQYENILFSIWKHHQDYEDEIGFPLKCFDNNTIYRVVKLALDAGLLIKTKNYSTGNHTRLYHKNLVLFDMIFRDKDNKYGKWLDSTKTNPEIDIIQCLLEDEFIKIGKDIDIPYVPTSSKSKKVKKLNYDLEKLHNLSAKIFPYYYELLLELNKAVIHNELKFISFIYFDKQGLPTGRPYSYFCSTLNPKKPHKDTSGEFRNDFLNRIGISDYEEVYDIKSEIPRINYLFHTGEWKDDTYDFYSEIIKDTNMLEKTGDAIPRGETEYTHYNDSMKQLFMRIYFGSGSDYQAWKGYLDERLQREKLIEIKNKKKTILDEGKHKYFLDMLENGEDMYFDLWKIVSASTEKICGASIGNLIFWYSFFIETEVKIELLNRGKKVYNVYDGFYYNKDIKNEIIEILKVKSKYVYDKYMKVIKI